MQQDARPRKKVYPVDGMARTCNAGSMPNVFETAWPAKTLAKGDRLLVPSASKNRRALWARAQMPVWDAPSAMTYATASQPWWLLQKGQVLLVLARPSKHEGLMWVNVSFQDGACIGWILCEHAYVCARHRAAKEAPHPALEKSRAPRTTDLRAGVVMEFNRDVAVVQSWSTDRLPTPHELARVLIEQKEGTKYVWLSQLRMP